MPITHLYSSSSIRARTRKSSPPSPERASRVAAGWSRWFPTSLTRRPWNATSKSSSVLVRTARRPMTAGTCCLGIRLVLRSRAARSQCGCKRHHKPVRAWSALYRKRKPWCHSTARPRTIPTDQGVVTQERRQTLDVQFIERVFMKNAKAYKCALYASAIRDGLRDGWAVDKRINGPRELTNYWIGEFLDSELRTTAASGTKRLAVAMRQAIRDTTNAGIREELLAATRLLRGQNGRHLPERLAHRLRVVRGTVQTLVSGLPRPELFFARHSSSILMSSTGASRIAPSTRQRRPPHRCEPRLRSGTSPARSRSG